jgi:hypothetical protein
MALGAAIRRFAGVTASPPVGATAQGARSPGTPQARAPRASAPWVGTPAGVPQAGALAAGTPPGAARASAPARAPAIRRGGDAEAADRRTGWAALAGGALLLVAPALAAVPLAWTVAAPVLTVRRDRARHDAQLHDQLPDVVDLLALTTAAGLPVAAALVAISDRPGGPLGRALARAGAHVRHGGSTGEALALLADAGPPARPLVDALVQHERYGTPLLPALERVGIEARSRRRRRAEETARRLPVTLLFPLVLTTFPAFVLLTVVPLLAGSLGSLSLSPT